MMNGILRHAARIRLSALFALLIIVGANPAYCSNPDITLSATTIDFKYIAGGVLPGAFTLNVKSTGTPLAFTIPTISTNWLSVSANSGTTAAAVKVYVNPTSMASGAYKATFEVDCAAAATPAQTVTVTLEISDPTPTLTPSTTSLSYSYVTDQTQPIASQLVTLTSSGGPVSCTVAATGGTWLSATPSGAIALAGIPATVTVSVNPAGLANANYTGTVKITPSDKTIAAIVVNVTLQVKAGTPSVTGLWPSGAIVNAPATLVTVTGTNFFPTSTVASGSTTFKGVTYISPTTLMVTIPAALLTTAGSVPLQVTTPTAAASSAINKASTFEVYPPGPQILAVTDGASYASGKISAGEIITIYGIGLGPASLASLTVSDPLATSLPSTGAATVVTINGVKAPLIYTSANQVSCIVPFAVAAQSGKDVDVSVSYNGVAAAQSKQVAVVDANPGLFSMDSSGSGPGAILNFNPATGDYTINSATNQAIKGTTIAVLYLTGVGLTDCTDIPPSTGFAGSACKNGATEQNLISGAVTPKLAVTVTIDGQPAPGAAAQAPIGSVPGLMQVNVPVPASVGSGAVPVVVSVGSGAGQVQSQAKVTLAVK